MTSIAAGASAAAIQSHYDVGTDFYRIWLDPDLCYSCALWDGADTLEPAQRAKLAYHTREAGVRVGDHVLDIGCGWGAQMRHVVSEAGARRATGLTLSQAQFSHVAAAGDLQADVKLQSWEDFSPAEPIDAIISVGAFEHFARVGLTSAQKLERYRGFFESCWRWLQPDRCLSLQTITYENADARDFSTFFENEIFPESDLPHPWEVIAAASGYFEVSRLRMDRDHYVRTLREWHSRLRAHRDQAVEAVGSATYERYSKYLQMCMIGFRTASMNLMRITFRRLPARTGAAGGRR